MHITVFSKLIKKKEKLEVQSTNVIKKKINDGEIIQYYSILYSIHITISLDNHGSTVIL